MTAAGLEYSIGSRDSKVATEEDPLGYNVVLPLHNTYYPMGFPLTLATNSETVLSIADRLWSRWTLRRERRPAMLRIIVSDRDSPAPVSPGFPHGQGHLVSIVQNAANFAVCDLASSFAFIHLSHDIACDAAWLRYHFLDPIAYLLIDAAHLVPLHASSIALGGRAMVLCGESGAGKTSLAYYCCSRRGWTYLSGDATHIVRGGSRPTVAGRPFSIRFRKSARELFPELNEFPPEARPNGRLDLEIETRELNISVAEEAAAGNVIFLDRREDAALPSLNPCLKSQAIERLRRLVCYGDDRIRREQNGTLDQFLELPTFQLTWRDFAAAESVLRELAVQNGRA